MAKETTLTKVTPSTFKERVQTSRENTLSNVLRDELKSSLHQYATEYNKKNEVAIEFDLVESTKNMATETVTKSARGIVVAEAFLTLYKIEGGVKSLVLRSGIGFNDIESMGQTLTWKNMLYRDMLTNIVGSAVFLREAMTKADAEK